MSRFADYSAEQAEAWGAAPWERVAETNAPSHDNLVARLGPRAGERWLDIGTGTGAVAIRAARAGADVTAIDLAPALVETARRLAAESGVDVRFEVGDAERLPYEDGSFDVVSSAFGVIFAPDQQAAAGELARLTRRGGRLGLTCLHPRSSTVSMFRMLWRFSPRPEGAGDPADWGREDHVSALLGDAFELHVEAVETPRESASPEEAWSFVSGSVGPVKATYEGLAPDRREEFRSEFLAHLEREQGQPGRYVLVLGTRR